MDHAKLNHAPVSYVLAQVRFSNIDDIADYFTKLHVSIRDKFPLSEDITTSTIQSREGQAPLISTVTQKHYVDKNKQIGVILDKQAITFHTSNYNQFSEFLSSLKFILKQLESIVKIALQTRIGLRYVNFIETSTPNLNPALLGFHLRKKDFFVEDKFLSKMETTQVSSLGIIKLQALHVGNKDIISGTKNFYVPPELEPIATFLKFDDREVSKKEFLLLDIDHFNESQKDFIPEQIIDQLETLQNASYSAFREAVGEKALKNWE